MQTALCIALIHAVPLLVLHGHVAQNKNKQQTRNDDDDCTGHARAADCTLTG